MNLAALLDAPWVALDHLERYVNLGSPSGFSDSWTTSPETAPRSDVPSFLLHRLSSAQGKTSHFGLRSSIPPELGEDDLLIHPDVAKRVGAPPTVAFDSFRVSPTASGRTVHVLAERPYHLKLHYDAVIGRLERTLGTKQASYAVYVNDVIASAIKRRLTCATFGILPEPAARVLTVEHPDGPREFGLVYRSLSPATAGSQPHALVPAFALFSPDTKQPDDELLVVQLLRASGLSAEEFLLEKLAFPVVDSYFTLLVSTGLQGEFHAQNTVFGIDPRGWVHCALLRDMESLDTDLDLRRELGLSEGDPPSFHKAIDRSMHNYQIKHSFMFDHKLGEYLLEPLIDTLANRGLVNTHSVDEAIRDRVALHLERFPADFLPRGCWYSFERRQIDRSTSERPYVRHEAPRFRRDAHR